MHIPFYKYQGAGNDFILVDNRELWFDASNTKLIENLCNRRFGIGADGLMLLQNKIGYDFEMIYFNADGRLSSMCGNGGRCITAFANQLGLITSTCKFLAVDGDHEASIFSAGENKVVKLKMNNVNEVEVGSDFYFLNTGSPHYVQFLADVAHMDVYEKGREVRYSARFMQEGTNVNFVEQHNDYLFVRTYERGVEDETLSCGTGVTACALAMAMKTGIQGQGNFAIKTLGGDLKVYFNEHKESYDDIWLEGPATFVFKGDWNG